MPDRLIRSFVAHVTILAACGGDERMVSTAGETSGGACYDRSEWEDCGVARPPRPETFRPRGSGGFTCGTPSSSCDSVTGPQDTWSPEATAALECILTGIRDRIPATYAWQYYENGGQYDVTYTLELLPNDTVIWSESGYLDLSCGWSETMRTAPPTKPIDDCLASQDPGTYWSCLNSILDGTECTGPAECP